ncbi:MAG: acetoin dehydrogenase dihydrolipoyllysine-residue acetyltransferase subunit [Candidatus Competibacteraceae bacterium]|nr:acetoin dehydrogenase dihydrolipoyllysine-residue acetyltransferase subunit [Candidatus Competibacteraceae bacterium]
MAGQITPIVMPKWGLSMREGTVNAWLVEEGATIEVGMPILEVETDKLASAVEAADAGLLRRRIAQEGDVLPVKALLGVMAPVEVSDAEIDVYVAAYVVPTASDDEEEAGSVFHTVEVDGIGVRYARRGPEDGTPVLFIHGFGGDLDNWLFNIDAVAEQSPVIVFDLPGHGQSDVQLPGLSLDALAAFVVHFLDAINVKQVRVVGHSLGGAIAAQMASNAPDRVASLALISPAGFGAEINAGYIEGFVNAQSRRELKPVLEQLFADPALVSRQMLDDMLKYKRMDGVESLLAGLGAALFKDGQQTARMVDALAASGKPVLVMWGRDDRVIPSAHAANAPKDATVKLFDGAGHMAMLEKAHEVNAAIKAHLEH